MAVQSGTVEAVAQKVKVFDTKYGPKCHRNFKLDDGKWYTLMWDDPEVPGVNRGARVSFMFKEKQNGKYTNLEVEKKTLEVEGGQDVRDSNINNNSGGSPRVAAPVNNTQLAIQHQASRNSAIAIVTCAVEQGLVKLPTKQADKYDAVLALVDNLTARFNDDTSRVVQTGVLPTIKEEEQQEESDDPDDEIPF